MDKGNTNILIYSKPGCPFCDKAKDFLGSLDITYIEHKLDPTDPEYAIQRNTLFSKFNHKSFPLIIIGTTFLGGFKELQNAYDTLRLHALCKEIDINIDIDF